MMLRHVFAGLALALFLAAPAPAEVKIQEVTSEKGFRAWLAEDHSIPFVALELAFRGGSGLDAPGREGTVSLMTGLLDQGAGELDNIAFGNARDALAANFRFNSGQDFVTVSARMLTENRDEAADLLRLALNAPRFDPEEIERRRDETLVYLERLTTDPNFIAERELIRMTWGDHPYGSPGDGTPESVKAITREDILAAHRSAVVKDRVYVAAAGDISPEELGKLVDHLLGDLPEAHAALPETAPWNLTGGVTVRAFPSPQSVVTFADRGIRRSDPDYHAAQILDHAMGGGINSRLMTEVRARRGLTYGIYTSLFSKRQSEMMKGFFSASNEKVAEAIRVIREEWKRAAEEGLTEEELSSVKDYLTGSFPLQFDGNVANAGLLLAMQIDNLPTDYPARYADHVRAVTAEDVRRVAKRLLDPERLRFVVVGQPAGLDGAEKEEQ